MDAASPLIARVCTACMKGNIASNKPAAFSMAHYLTIKKICRKATIVMPMALLKVRIRNLTRSHAKKRAIYALLQGLWDLDPNTRSAAYTDHLEDVLSLQDISDSDKFTLSDSLDVIDLVHRVKEKKQNTLQDIKNDLQGFPPTWMVGPVNERSAEKVIGMAIRLWLFTNPESFSWPQDLKDVVQQSLPTPATEETLAANAPPPRFLSSDFTAKSLTRKGGISLVWTSYLGEHLTFVGKARLRIFRHASVLRKYAKLETRDLYPNGFLEETEETLRLLFPPVNHKSARRTRHIEEREDVDIEAAIADHTVRDLRNYPFWGERLQTIQETYDAARPKRIKQWWFDRRDKLNWGAFWIAITVFVLTLVFGVIQSVTGIMQVA